LQLWDLIHTSWKRDQNFPKYPDLTPKKENKFVKGCTSMAVHPSKKQLRRAGGQVSGAGV
jgi:hypothetical protein